MMNFDILFENSGVIAALKPAGMPVEPDPNGDEDMLSALRDFLRENGKPSALFLVHRLDRPVGGIVLFARKKEDAARLSEQFAGHDAVGKTYFAVTSSPLPEEGKLRDLLWKDARAGKAFVTDRMRNGVKEAELIAKHLETVTLPDGSSRSLYGVRLLTGRFHQIRIQFASRKAPLLGDGKYGSRDNHCNVALFAGRLRFSDRGKSVVLTANLPNGYPWNLFSEGSYISLPDELL